MIKILGFKIFKSVWNDAWYSDVVSFKSKCKQSSPSLA